MKNYFNGLEVAVVIAILFVTGVASGYNETVYVEINDSSHFEEPQDPNQDDQIIVTEPDNEEEYVQITHTRVKADPLRDRAALIITGSRTVDVIRRGGVGALYEIEGRITGVGAGVGPELDLESWKSEVKDGRFGGTLILRDNLTSMAVSAVSNAGAPYTLLCATDEDNKSDVTFWLVEVDAGEYDWDISPGDYGDTWPDGGPYREDNYKLDPGEYTLGVGGEGENWVINFEVLAEDTEIVILHGENHEETKPLYVCYDSEGPAVLELDMEQTVCVNPEGVEWELDELSGTGTNFQFGPGLLDPGQYTAVATCPVNDSIDEREVVVIKVDITKDDDSIITETQNTFVGVHFNLVGKVEPADLVLDSKQWTIPGEIAKEWDVEFTDIESDTSAEVVEVEPSDLQQSEIEYFWIDGNPNRNVYYTIQIGNLTCEAKANFNIQRPDDVTVTTHTSEVDVNEFPDNEDYPFDWYLHCGRIDKEWNDVGVHFIASPDPAGPGTYVIQWVSVFDHYSIIRHRMSDGNWEKKEGADVLDTLYPASSTYEFDDSPASRLDVYYKLTRSDSFKTYFMFKYIDPDVTSSWVPIRKIEWNWSGEASYNPGEDEWDLDSKSDPTISSSVTTTYPTWDGNVEHLEYEDYDPENE